MGNAYRSVLALKPTGDAVPANVLAGKTFSNTDGVGKTGTMVNNGAVSITLTDLDPTYTIPEGYHNGLGVVGFSASGGDGADLIVTCTADFAGSTITCTDGSTYTKSQTCPSSSPYEVTFESIPTGTYTISGVASGQTITITKTITDFDLFLADTPDGSTVTPTDDIQTWLYCANIWDKTYTTISDVLADGTTVTALIASNNAADYMARSTSWANSVTANASAMTKIGANDYCADKLLDNSTWLNAICNSTYFESVLNVKVPTMTSDTTPSGVVSQTATSAGSSFPAYRSFDGNDSSYNAITPHSATLSNSTTEWIQYDFGFDLKINHILFNYISSAAGKTANISKIKVSGSDDGVTFSDISSIAISSNNAYYPISNQSKYRYIRVYITDGTFSDIGNLPICIKTLQFYGRT